MIAELNQKYEYQMEENRKLHEKYTEMQKQAAEVV